MRPQKKEALASWIETLSDTAGEDPNAQLAQLNDKMYLTSVGNKYAAELRKLSDTLLEEGGWGLKLSGDYVEQGILKILLELADGPTDRTALPLLEQLANSFDSYDEQRTVYIPLSGIKMTDVDELIFGEVVLKKMTEDQKEAIAQTLDTEEERTTFFSSVRVVPFAEVMVSTEPIKAWEVSKDKLRDVIDLLRYLMPFLSDEALDPDINLLGLQESSLPLTAIHDGKLENLFGSLRDLPTSVEISQEAIRKMEEAGFFEAVKFAGKEKKTDLELAVLRGIQWTSDSQGQRQYGNKLLSLTIALECLLPSERSGGRVWSSEGAALLLGQNHEERIKVRDRIRGLYNRRNAIVHRGGGQEVTRGDVVEARKVVHDVIRTIISRRDEFEDRNGAYVIATWLEDRKMAGRP